MTTVSNFLPIVTVSDNDEISVEWMDSFEATIDDATQEILDSEGAHSTFLDMQLAQIREMILLFRKEQNWYTAHKYAEQLVELISPFFITD